MSSPQPSRARGSRACGASQPVPHQAFARAARHTHLLHGSGCTRERSAASLRAPGQRTCLMELPLKAASPANFLAGRDSPVSAAWSHCSSAKPFQGSAVHASPQAPALQPAPAPSQPAPEGVSPDCSCISAAAAGLPALPGPMCCAMRPEAPAPFTAICVQARTAATGHPHGADAAGDRQAPLRRAELS